MHFGLIGQDSVTVEVTFLTAEGRSVKRFDNIRPADYVGGVFHVRQQ